MFTFIFYLIKQKAFFLRYAILILLAAGALSGCGGNNATVKPIAGDDSAGNLGYVVLPAPNASDGLDYETEEFKNNPLSITPASTTTVTASASTTTVTTSASTATVTTPASTTTVTTSASTATININALERMNAHIAYQRGYFGQQVTVGVVDTGVNVIHPALTANIVPGGYNYVTDSTVVAEHSGDAHGTRVAGIIAAARDGNVMHGIAPSAKIMPFAAVNSQTSVYHAVERAVTLGVQIVNNSYGDNIPMAGYYVDNGVSIAATVSTPPQLSLITHLGTTQGIDYYDLYTRVYPTIYTNILSNRDVVLVWSAGNSRWNTDTGVHIFRNSIASVTVGITSVINNFVGMSVRGGMSFTTKYSTLGLNPNAAARGRRISPLINSALLGKNVVVAALAYDVTTTRGSRSSRQLAFFSNGCGDAKHYCISAPGQSIRSTGLGDKYVVGSGTSFAAPYVSGALAVLKSRFPDMPMEAVLVLLYATAQDLGDTGVDEVYGHGLVDLGAATTVQGSMQLVVPSAGSGGSSSSSGTASSLAESKISLPPAFAGMMTALNDMSLAVSYLDGSYYYNTPLSGLVTQKSGRLSALGHMAEDMLLPSAVLAVWRKARGRTSTFACGGICVQPARYLRGNITWENHLKSRSFWIHHRSSVRHGSGTTNGKYFWRAVFTRKWTTGTICNGACVGMTIMFAALPCARNFRG